MLSSLGERIGCWVLSLKHKHVEINLKALQPRFLNIRGPRTSEEVWSLAGAKHLEVGGGFQSAGRTFQAPEDRMHAPRFRGGSVFWLFIPWGCFPVRFSNG